MKKKRVYQRWTTPELEQLHGIMTQAEGTWKEKEDVFESFAKQLNASADSHRTHESLRARYRRYLAGQTTSRRAKNTTGRTKTRKLTSSKKREARRVDRDEDDQASSPENSFRIRPPPVLQLAALTFHPSSMESESSSEVSPTESASWTSSQTAASEFSAYSGELEYSRFPTPLSYMGLEDPSSPARSPLRRTYLLPTPNLPRSNTALAPAQGNVALGKKKPTSIRVPQWIWELVNYVL